MKTLQEELEKYGNVKFYEESETSIMMLMIGIDLDKKTKNILYDFADFKGGKFPLIENLINTDTYFLIILKP